MREFLRGIRLSVRSLRRTPGFTAVAVLTLVIGIGANTAIFSAIQAILLHPLPVSNADRVVFVSTYLPKTRAEVNVLTPAEYQDLAERRDLFADVGAYNAVTVTVTGTAGPERVDAVTTAGALFSVLRVKPLAGRLYDSTDIRANRRVVMLSYDYWRRRTGGSAGTDVLGTSMTIDDSAYTIVGVLPRGLDFPHGVGIWSPRQLRQGACAKLDRDRNDPLSHSCKYATTVARLRNGVGIAQVRTALASIMAQWRRATPVYYQSTEQVLHVNTLTTVIAGDIRPILLLLFAASAFVLLIACVNVACLQLVRTTGRVREIALRAALGANRVSTAAHIVGEALIVAVLGGGGGVFLGRLIIGTAKTALTTLPIDPETIRLDPTVVAFAFGAIVITAILCALVPVLRATSVDAADVLRGGGGTRNASAGRQRVRFLSGAVVVQIAAALALVAGCAVAVESFARLTAVDPGFRADGLVTMRIVLPVARYRGWSKITAFSSELSARVAAIPGVHGVATAAGGPYDAQRNESSIRPVTSAEQAGTPSASISPFFNMISARYFDVLGVRIVAGRAFDESDVAVFHSDTLVQIGTVVIDETLARQIYPAGDAVGKKLGPFAPMPTIIGVVNATRELKLATSGAGNIYYPGGDFLRDKTLVIRTSLPLTAIAPMLRAIVHDVDPALPIANIDAVRHDIDRTLTPRRIASKILGAFAGMALVLAMLGIYGVLSYSVAQRRKEMGIRLALGAAPAQLLRFVVGGVARLAIIGLGIGAIVFLAVARYLQALVYGVSARDPLTIIFSALGLGALALLAAWIPARSAAAVDPAQTLRVE